MGVQYFSTFSVKSVSVLTHVYVMRLCSQVGAVQLAFGAIVLTTLTVISHQLQRAPFLFSEMHNAYTSILFSLKLASFHLPLFYSNRWNSQLQDDGHVCNEQLVFLEHMKDYGSTTRPSPFAWVELE